jgi:prophage antirepressor-like protein
MSNKLRVFNFEGADVRTVMKNGEPWWVLKDVCDVLGIEKYRDAAARLDDDEKTKIDPKYYFGLRSNEPTTVVSASGLYSVILLSRKPNAKTFKRWAFGEVLSTIRKHGMYTTEELLDDPALLYDVITKLRDERGKCKALETKICIQDQQLAELRSKASYYDVILNAKDTVSISRISKDYGKSVIWLNEYLRSKGVQFKQGDVWLLYAKHAEQGYTCTKVQLYPAPNGEMHSKVHTRWTQKGRLYLYELLKVGGVLPLIEQERPAV